MTSASNGVGTPLGFASLSADNAPMKTELAEQIRREDYTVDPEAVAAAMLAHARRDWSKMLVAAEPVSENPCGVAEGEALAGDGPAYRR